MRYGVYYGQPRWSVLVINPQAIDPLENLYPGKIIRMDPNAWHWIRENVDESIADLEQMLAGA